MTPSSPSVVRVRNRRPLAAGALTLWIAISPWLWGFAGAHPAVANHVFLVLAFGPLAVMMVALRPAALVTLSGGVWLALSPWVLGYAGNHTAWLNELVTGASLSALAASCSGLTGRLRPQSARWRARRPGDPSYTS
ncbi:MAG: SPW repeat protein [Solirubrobacterales bacterium]|nr:SPW repeat protein [Solirubrobacterales bacterium]